MKRLKIDKKRASANFLPLDCWGIISSFLSYDKDFMLLCSTVRGFHQYASTLNVNCANSVAFQIRSKQGIIALDMAQRSIPFVKELFTIEPTNFNGYKTDELAEKVRQYFPNLKVLIFKHQGGKEDSEETVVSGFKKLERLSMSMLKQHSKRVKIQNNPVLEHLTIFSHHYSTVSPEFFLSKLPKLERLFIYENRVSLSDEQIRQNIKELTINDCDAREFGINTMKNLATLDVNFGALYKSGLERIYAPSLKNFRLYEESEALYTDDFEEVGLTLDGIDTLESIDMQFDGEYLVTNPTLFQFRNLPNVKHFKLTNYSEELDSARAQLTIDANWEKLETFHCIGFSFVFPNLSLCSSLRSLKLGVDSQMDYVASTAETIKLGVHVEEFPLPYPSGRDLEIASFKHLEELKLCQFQGSFGSFYTPKVVLESLTSLDVVTCLTSHLLLMFVHMGSFPKLQKLKITLPYRNLNSFDLSYYARFKLLEKMHIKFWQRLPTNFDERQSSVFENQLPSSSKMVIPENFFPSLKDFQLETVNSTQLVFSVVKIMKSMKIRSCKIDGAETVLVNNCPSLEVLEIRRSKDLTVVGCPRLKSLCCYHTEIAFMGFEESWKNSLEKLTIRNQNEQRLANILPSVAGFKKLQRMELRNFFVDKLESLPLLKSLNFSLTNDASSRIIENLPSIESVRVHSTEKGTGRRSIVLKNLPNLKSLEWKGGENWDVKIDEISRSNLERFGNFIN